MSLALSTHGRVFNTISRPKSPTTAPSFRANKFRLPLIYGRWKAGLLLWASVRSGNGSEHKNYAHWKATRQPALAGASGQRTRHLESGTLYHFRKPLRLRVKT